MFGLLRVYIHVYMYIWRVCCTENINRRSILFYVPKTFSTISDEHLTACLVEKLNIKLIRSDI